MDLFSHLTSYSVEILYSYWHILQKHNSQLLCEKAKKITINKLLQILHSWFRASNVTKKPIISITHVTL